MFDSQAISFKVVIQLKHKSLDGMHAVSANERNRGDSLEGEGAAIKLLGSAETSLLGRGAAEQQELVGGVHEFQLLAQ